MKLLKSFLICSIFLSAAYLSYAQIDASKVKDLDPAVRKIISIEAAGNQTMKHLDVMTNRFGGRLLGSDAFTHAADWAAYMFEKWGLEVQKEYAGELPVGFNRGPWFGRMINGNMSLHFSTPSYTAGTKGLQRGTVVKEPKTTAEFERIKHTLNGAWVLIGGVSKGWPIDQSAGGDSLRAIIIAKNDTISEINRENRYYNYRISGRRRELNEQLKSAGSKKELARIEKELAQLKEKKDIPLIEEPGLFFRQMKEAGMLGMIQSSKVPITALYDRKNIDANTIVWDNLPEIPDIKLDERQYAIIKEMVDKKEYVQLEFDIRNHFYMGPVPYHNVIAILRGTEFPEEYLICCGHLDSFDSATGGIDCGSGIAPTMETARILAAMGEKPKRSIMFVLWAGEEYGLWGSKYWVKNHPGKLPNVINVFNRDGGPTVADSWSVPKEWYDMVEPVCAPLYDLDPRFPFTLKVGESYPRAVPKNAGGTDAASFANAGVPAIGFGTGDPLGYNFEYYEIWHTDRDLYSKSIPVYMEYTSLVNAIILWGVANLEKRLPAEAVYKK